MPEDKRSRLRRYMDYVEGGKTYIQTATGDIPGATVRRVASDAAHDVRRPAELRRAAPAAAGASSVASTYASKPRTPHEPSQTRMTEDEQRALDEQVRGARGRKQRSAAEAYASQYRSK